MATNKKTKMEMFKELLEIPAIKEDEEKNAFVLHEIELLENKKSSTRKQSKTQIENTPIKEDIVKYLKENRPNGYTATQIGVGVKITLNKASSLLTQLKNEGRVVRKEDGKKVLFYAPNED